MESTNPEVTLITADRRKWWLDLRELYHYRELLFVLTARDLKVRYKQTALGVIWAVLQPLANMLLFTLIFGRLAKLPSDGFPYPIFVFAGLLPWTFFANSISASAESIVGASTLITRVYFPRLIIPLASVCTALVDFAIAFFILLILMLFYGVGWSLNLLLAPVLIIALGFTALGVGTMLAALNVSYRDFRYLVPFGVQFWMFASPVVYPSSMIPEKWRWLYHINPVAGIIDGFRAVFLGSPLDWTTVSTSMLASVVIFLIGVMMFDRAERRFADVI
ncbi:MAG: ABC transporter permease [Rhodothermia bacterium]|nr:MAG: ABC transporter permease [Rhodothermia bacterium]